MNTQHRHELVKIDGPSGKLSGTLHIPDGEIRGVVLFAHCFTCSRSLKTTQQMSTGIEDGGFAVLRFDFTGLGQSDGDFGETNVTTNIEDLQAAAEYLGRRDLGPLVMAGHSLGGAATLLAAGDVTSAKAVVVVSAPFRPSHVRHLFTETEVARVVEEGRATVSIAGRPFDISRAFFEDLERHCTPERIAALQRPLLVVHGAGDTIVNIAEGEYIHAAAAQPKWFAAIPEADHMFMNPQAAKHATAAIRTFLHIVI